MAENGVNHLGIIMDGNRRWAEERMLPSFEGHRRGAENVERVIRWCAKREIKFLTLYAFSTENWQRTKEEVGSLMKLMEFFLEKKIEAFQKEKGKLRVMGERDALPQSLVRSIEKAEKLTAGNDGIRVNLLISYGGRKEIVEALRRAINDKITSAELTEEKIQSYLYAADLPDPDLIIRTGGEQRLSNFLTWQSAYSELYFTPKYWPDFNENDLDEALTDYLQRQRRKGK